jgi:hypothetical protein
MTIRTIKRLVPEGEIKIVIDGGTGLTSLMVIDQVTRKNAILQTITVGDMLEVLEDLVGFLSDNLDV